MGAAELGRVRTGPSGATTPQEVAAQAIPKATEPSVP